MKKRLILASASPRRSDILTSAGYEFETAVSKAEELKEGDPCELVRLNALFKARDIYEKTGGNAVVLGADTVVCLDGKVLGKPNDDADAVSMLKRLSGTKHSVLTGYAVISEFGEKSGFCETLVEFRTISDREIEDYVSTGEPLDKAGAYGIQERASLFVSRIEGDYFNVMGLPVSSLCHILSGFGIKPSWQKEVLSN